MILNLFLCVICALCLAMAEDMRRKLKQVRGQKEIIELAAKKRANKIIDEANMKALKLVEEAKFDAENKRKSLEARLEAIGNSQLGEYKQNLQSVSKSIEEEFKVKALQQVEAEILAYKEEKMKHVQLEVEKIVKEASRIVLGKSLSNEDHLKLIIEALEEARTNHVI